MQLSYVKQEELLGGIITVNEQQGLNERWVIPWGHQVYPVAGLNGVKWKRGGKWKGRREGKNEKEKIKRGKGPDDLACSPAGERRRAGASVSPWYYL